MKIRRGFILFIVLATLAITALSPFLSRPKSFVSLQPGTYLGDVTLNGLEPFSLLIHLPLGGKPSVKNIDGADVSDFKLDNFEAPNPVLSFKQKDQRNFMVGNRTDSTRAAGIVLSSRSFNIGRWELRKLELYKLEGEAEKNTAARFAALQRARAGLIVREEQIDLSSVNLRNELERLRSLIREGRTLREVAVGKLEKAEEEMSKLERDVAERKKKAIQLLSKLQIAQRVTAQGSLVTLSRQAIDREARWLESSLKSVENSRDPAFERAWSRSQEILALRNEIARERREIEQLMGGGY